MKATFNLKELNDIIRKVTPAKSSGTKYNMPHMDVVLLKVFNSDDNNLSSVTVFGSDSYSSFYTGCNIEEVGYCSLTQEAIQLLKTYQAQKLSTVQIEKKKNLQVVITCGDNSFKYFDRFDITTFPSPSHIDRKRFFKIKTDAFKLAISSAIRTTNPDNAANFGVKEHQKTVFLYVNEDKLVVFSTDSYCASVSEIDYVFKSSFFKDDESLMLAFMPQTLSDLRFTEEETTVFVDSNSDFVLFSFISKDGVNGEVACLKKNIESTNMVNALPVHMENSIEVSLPLLSTIAKRCGFFSQYFMLEQITDEDTGQSALIVSSTTDDVGNTKDKIVATVNASKRLKFTLSVEYFVKLCSLCMSFSDSGDPIFEYDKPQSKIVIANKDRSWRGYVAVARV